jgi:mannosyltransferase PIG-V
MVPLPRNVCSTFVLTRVALFAVALFAVSHLPINVVEARGFHLAPQPHPYLEAWARYDACWYVTIAEEGYRGPIETDADIRPAFFPLFPAFVAVADQIVRLPLLSGLIVSNLCYLTFLILLWHMVRLDWPDDVAARTTWIYLLFPSAMFLSGVYSESALMALTAGSVLAARRRRWLLAGILAGLATIARPVGVAIVAALVAELWTISSSDHEMRSAWPRDLIALLVPVIVAVASYLVFATVTFGNPLVMVSSQASIRGPIAAPWQAFADFWNAGPHLHGFGNSILDAVLALAAVAALPVIISRMRPSYAVYAGLVVLISLSGSLISFNRLLLPSFPHAILLARTMKRPLVAVSVLVTFALLEALTMTAFATWNWVA